MIEKLKLTSVITALAASATLAACVTINIYFPAAAAEKAADKIIDEVWQVQKESGKMPQVTPPTAPSTPAK